MKFTPADLATLRDLITPLDTAERRVRYRIGDFPRAALVKDLDMRYRWDLLWTVSNHPAIRELRKRYPADAHLDTALRAVVSVL